MVGAGSSIQGITDTARCVSMFRAQETGQADALFRDPYARRLAGAPVARIAEEFSSLSRYAWAFVVRTFLFDALFARHVGRGVDAVLNLGAGLDARPYRMPLPRSLRWIEVDVPEILDEKESVLRRETPRCALERVPLDLARASARRALFDRIGRCSRATLILSEGLLIYLTADAVARLACDLSLTAGFRHWALDLVSPEALCVLRWTTDRQFSRAFASFRFGPSSGPDFFSRYGWQPSEAHSVPRTALRARRLPHAVQNLSLLQEALGVTGPWSSVCLLRNRGG